jgi:GxxExxY protein
MTGEFSAPNDPFSAPNDPLTEKIIGVFYEVYNELGFGFLESVYREAMRIALGQVGLRVAGCRSRSRFRYVFAGRLLGISR